MKRLWRTELERAKIWCQYSTLAYLLIHLQQERVLHFFLAWGISVHCDFLFLG